MCVLVRGCLVIILCCLVSLQAYAGAFAPIGAESISMGGAGVASARMCYAPYYNPALLAEAQHTYDIGFALEASVREVDLAEHIDKLSDINIDNTLTVLEDPLANISQVPNALNDVSLFIGELRQIPLKNGLQLMPGIDLGCQIKNAGFGFYTVSEATANAVIDQNHLDIIVQNTGAGPPYYRYDPVNGSYSVSNETEYRASSLQYALDNGLTYLDLTGLAYVEIPLAYGYGFDTPYGKLDVGGSIKIMPGYTLDKNIKINTESGDVNTDLREDRKSSTSWGIDLGLLYKLSSLPGLAVGLVGKNLNTPKFKTASDDLKVKPQVRMGLAYVFLPDKLSAALDLDLTKNETFIPGYDSQYIGGGLNYQPVGWLALRGGLMQNLTESSEGTIVTFGLGLGPRWLQFDLAAMASTKTAQYQGSSIPRYAKVQLGLSSTW